MDHRTYCKLSRERLIGRQVRLTRSIETQRGVVFDEGTVMEIVGKHGGFELRAPRCSHCNLSPGITKVSPADVELVD